MMLRGNIKQHLTKSSTNSKDPCQILKKLKNIGESKEMPKDNFMLLRKERILIYNKDKSISFSIIPTSIVSLTPKHMNQ